MALHHLLFPEGICQKGFCIARTPTSDLLFFQSFKFKSRFSLLSGKRQTAKGVAKTKDHTNSSISVELLRFGMLHFLVHLQCHRKNIFSGIKFSVLF